MRILSHHGFRSKSVSLIMAGYYHHDDHHNEALPITLMSSACSTPQTSVYPPDDKSAALADTRTGAYSRYAYTEEDLTFSSGHVLDLPEEGPSLLEGTFARPFLDAIP